MLRSSTRSFLAQFRNARAIHSSRSLLKAEFFKMPAMSPTMEKGGVTDWKFKEGDHFNSGDVLLEVETDKAQIDVEAQDDGILAKILVPNGGKDIAVGTPIAILAEPTDDLSTLELPSVEASAATTTTPAPTPAPSTPAPEPVKQETKKPSAPSSSSTSLSTKANPNQVFFPSVISLLNENNISREDALSKIQATGPNGRIVKGDVLAFLGKIPQESVNSISAFIDSHTRLDLSNIERLKITPKSTTSSSSSTSTTVKEEEVKKQPKPEAKIITKTFNLDHVYDLQAEALEKGYKPFTLKSYIEKASKRAETYAYKSHPKRSDYYDDVFESLLVPDGTVERFSIDLDIPSETQSSGFAYDTVDFFQDQADDLFEVPNGHDVHEFTVTLKVAPNVLDAEEKANLYLKKLEYYIQH